MVSDDTPAAQLDHTRGAAAGVLGRAEAERASAHAWGSQPRVSLWMLHGGRPAGAFKSSQGFPCALCFASAAPLRRSSPTERLCLVKVAGRAEGMILPHVTTSGGT